MDGNKNNKVYVNPNFKRTPLIKTWSFVHTNTSPNIYKDFPQQIQNEKVITEKHLNRRIYVNPNFKQVNQKELYSNAPERREKDENTDVYPKLISKSKYALVANINKSKIDVRNNSREDKTCSSINATYSKTVNLYTENNCTQNVLNDKYQMGVPIIKSRYTLVRKNNVVSDDKKEIMPKIPEIPIGSSSLNLCCLNSHTTLFKNQENNNSKPSEKVTKIKISKYKTVPITHLNFSLAKVEEYKLNPSMSQSYTNTAKPEVSYKNRYKLTRPSSKHVANIVNTTKTYNRTVNKSVWHNQSKRKLLKANFKINNIPCRLFTKYGKCLRKDYGKCEYLHDKKHVSLCRKFLKGICHDINCPLSHELTANKMPTCFFYLKGICTKVNCPYLHIKLNDKTKVCPNFTRGYCEKGDTCKYRHVKVNHCKKLKILINNSCNRLPNQSTKLKKGKTESKHIKKKNLTQLNEQTNIKTQNEEQSNVDCSRYYKEMVSNEDSCKNIKPTRCKIGTLPSFIQF